MHPGFVVYSPSSCFHYSGNIFKRWDLLDFRILSRGMWQSATSFDSLKIRPEWGIPVSHWEFCAGGNIRGGTYPFVIGIQEGLSIIASRGFLVLRIVISSTEPLNESTVVLNSPFFLPLPTSYLALPFWIHWYSSRIGQHLFGGKCHCQFLPYSPVSKKSTIGYIC